MSFQEGLAFQLDLLLDLAVPTLLAVIGLGVLFAVVVILDLRLEAGLGWREALQRLFHGPPSDQLELNLQSPKKDTS